MEEGTCPPSDKQVPSLGAAACGGYTAPSILVGVIVTRSFSWRM